MSIIFKLVADKSFIMESFEILVYLIDGVCLGGWFLLLEWFLRMVDEVDRLGIEPGFSVEASLVACGEAGEHDDDADEEVYEAPDGEEPPHLGVGVRADPVESEAE